MRGPLGKGRGEGAALQPPTPRVPRPGAVAPGPPLPRPHRPPAVAAARPAGRRCRSAPRLRRARASRRPAQPALGRQDPPRSPSRPGGHPRQRSACPAVPPQPRQNPACPAVPPQPPENPACLAVPPQPRQNPACPWCASSVPSQSRMSPLCLLRIPHVPAVPPQPRHRSACPAVPPQNPACPRCASSVPSQPQLCPLAARPVTPRSPVLSVSPCAPQPLTACPGTSPNSPACGPAAPHCNPRHSPAQSLRVPTVARSPALLVPCTPSQSHLCPLTVPSVTLLTLPSCPLSPAAPLMPVAVTSRPPVSSQSHMSHCSPSPPFPVIPLTVPPVPPCCLPLLVPSVSLSPLCHFCDSCPKEQGFPTLTITHGTRHENVFRDVSGEAQLI